MNMDKEDVRNVTGYIPKEIWDKVVMKQTLNKSMMIRKK